LDFCFVLLVAASEGGSLEDAALHLGGHHRLIREELGLWLAALVIDSLLLKVFKLYLLALVEHARCLDPL